MLKCRNTNVPPAVRESPWLLASVGGMEGGGRGGRVGGLRGWTVTPLPLQEKQAKHLVVVPPPPSFGGLLENINGPPWGRSESHLLI